MNMTLSVRCSSCGAKYELGEEYWNQHLICYVCRATFYVSSPPQAAGKPSFASEKTIPAEWRVGDVILDLYEVRQIYEAGGMGVVYRVHHRGWQMDLAVKSPRPQFFQTEKQKADFVRECEAWISLGMHPHIVSCYYVRNLGG